MCNQKDEEAAASEAQDFSTFVPVIASVLTHITQRNKEVTITSEKLKLFHSLQVPPIGTRDYVNRIIKCSYCNPECFIFNPVNRDRLITANKNCHITPYNVHRLLITSLLLAAKVSDYTHYSNAYYSGRFRQYIQCRDQPAGRCFLGSCRFQSLCFTGDLRPVPYIFDAAFKRAGSTRSTNPKQTSTAARCG